MGKIRATKRDFKKSMKASVASSGDSKSSNNESQLKTTVGKISADISAINLGLPRARILKKTNSSSNQNLLSSNFASRIKNLNKQKKKVTFCQNLIAEDLKEQSKSGEDAKHYFKVIHPSAIERRKGDKCHEKLASRRDTTTSSSQVKDLIPDETLISSTIPSLKKIIKKSIKSKKARLKVTRETYRKKIELLKLKKEELSKAKLRQQTVIVGDLHPILESLPDVPSKDEMEAEIISAAIKEKEAEQRLRIPKKTEKHSVKKTQKAMLDSLKFFEASGVGVTAGFSSTQ